MNVGVGRQRGKIGVGPVCPLKIADHHQLAARLLASTRAGEHIGSQVRRGLHRQTLGTGAALPNSSRTTPKFVDGWLKTANGLRAEKSSSPSARRGIRDIRQPAAGCA